MGTIDIAHTNISDTWHISQYDNKMEELKLDVKVINKTLTLNKKKNWKKLLNCYQSKDRIYKYKKFE